MARWYRDGTASVANGATAVTGSACAWATNVKPGDAIRFAGTDRLYEVESVASNTSLTLATAFAGTSVTGVAYEIQRMSTDHSLAASLSIRVGQLLDQKTMILSGSGPPTADIGSAGAFYVDRTNAKWHYREVAGWDAGLPYFGGPIGLSYGGSSTSSVAIGTADGEDRAFTVGGGLAYTEATRVRVAHDADNYIEGPCLSYTRETTGILTIRADKVKGSGTYTSWAVSVIGDWAGVPAVNAGDAGLQVLDDTPVDGTLTLNSRRMTELRTLASETIADAQRTKLIVLNRATAIAVSLTPSADGWFCTAYNIGAGLATITPAHGQINGASTLELATGQHAMLAYDGTSWHATVANAVRQVDLDALAADQTADLDAAVASLTSSISGRVASSILTAEGDMIVRGSSGPVRLAAPASSNLYPRSNTGIAGKVEWVSVPPGDFDIAAQTVDPTPRGKRVAGTTGSANVQFDADKIGGLTVIDFWDIVSFWPKSTGGAVARKLATANGNTHNLYDFSSTTEQIMFGRWKPPASWDGGAIKIRPMYLHSNAPVTSGSTQNVHASTSSTTIPTAIGQERTLTLSGTVAFTAVTGQPVFVNGPAVSGTYPNWFEGTIVDYSSSTRLLRILVTDFAGSGTLASWQIRTSVVWGLAGGFIANKSDLNQAVGTAVTLVCPLGPPNFLFTSPGELVITPSSGGLVNGLVYLQVSRKVADTMDNNISSATSGNTTNLAALMGFEMEWNRTRNYA